MSQWYKVEFPFEVCADDKESAANEALTDLMQLLPMDGVQALVTPSNRADYVTVRREAPKAPGSAPMLNYIHITRRDGTIFIPLPRESWRSAGKCDCDYCAGAEAFWDTLALAQVAPDRSHNDWTHTVHFPELHGAKKIKRR